MNNNTIFEDLKSELEQYNIESVAAEAGCAPATLYFWLQGKTKLPRLATVIKVADVLGYDVALVRRAAKLRLVA
jgi:transcriptional regulator with XRE-family HTH domain